MIVNWNKVKKVKQTFIFDGGPDDGGYVPQMSEEDAKTWRGKITGTRLKMPQAELRKTVAFGTQILIIVNLQGKYKNKGCEYDGYDVHMSCNGPMRMSFDEFNEIDIAVQEGLTKLRELAE